MTERALETKERVEPPEVDGDLARAGGDTRFAGGCGTGAGTEECCSDMEGECQMLMQ